MVFYVVNREERINSALYNEGLRNNYKHESLLLSVQLRLSYQSFFLASTCEQFPQILRASRNAQIM